MGNIPMTASSRKSNRRSGGNKRNGWTAKWSDELRLKKGESAWVIITPGKYPYPDGGHTHWLEVPMYKVKYTKTAGNSTWEAYEYFQGDGTENCTLHLRADCGDTRVQAPRRGEPNRFFMNVIHLDMFKRVPVLDKRTGEPLRYKNGKLKGEPIHRWETVTSTKEKKDRVSNGDLDDCLFYRKKFLELNFSQHKDIKAVAREAGKMCQCGGNLSPHVFACSQCEEIMLDVLEDDKGMTEGDIQEYRDSEVRCQSCGNVDYPTVFSMCDECDNPIPFRFWEVAARIEKVADGQYTKLKITKVVPLTEKRHPDRSPIILVDEDGEPMLGDESELLFEEGLDKLIKAQFDLEAYTACKGNEHYSDILELGPNDIGHAASSRNYGRRPGGFR